MNVVEGFFSHIGDQVLAFLRDLGGMVGLLFSALRWGLSPPYRLGLVFEQAESIGVGSLFIVALTGFFTGMVFAEQSNYAFGLFGAQGLTGATVTLTLTRELGPVLTALMVTGRSGSAMTTELGTMRVTEQIDALTTMAVNPVQYLVVPRLVAAVVMVPMLDMVFNVVGFIGAYGVSVTFGDQSAGTFLDRTQYLVDPLDIWSGIIKATVFGLVIALVACYRGIYAEGGSKGVGLATTEAVVTASIAIFILDYFLTLVLLM